jgi:hypothetical protein
VEIGTEAEQFLLWEYLFQNFGIVPLQFTASTSYQMTFLLFEFCVIQNFDTLKSTEGIRN